MCSAAADLPFKLGLAVRHSSDWTGPVGVVVGVLFTPSDQVLVRWPDGRATFEAPQDIVEVRRVA